MASVFPQLYLELIEQDTGLLLGPELLRHGAGGCSFVQVRWRLRSVRRVQQNFFDNVSGRFEDNGGLRRQGLGRILGRPSALGRLVIPFRERHPRLYFGQIWKPVTWEGFSETTTTGLILKRQQTKCRKENRCGTRRIPNHSWMWHLEMRVEFVAWSR